MGASVEQVHLSYGDAEDSMVVSWVTSEPTASSTVRFGLGKLDPINEGFCVLVMSNTVTLDRCVSL